MNIPYVMKKCTGCGRWLVASTDNFYKDKACKYGLKAECKECIKKRDKQYREANKDKKIEYKRRWRQTPTGQASRFNERHKRRTEEEQQGTGITKEQWLDMMSFFDWKCAYSGERLTKDNRTIDHIIPLNSNGDNMIWNVVPMKLNYNSSKCAKDMLEWYKEQDFYSEDRLAKIYEWQEYARKKWKIS